jgi:hypothetical protein
MSGTTSGPLSVLLLETRIGFEHHAISRDINRDKTSQNKQIFPAIGPPMDPESAFKSSLCNQKAFAINPSLQPMY